MEKEQVKKQPKLANEDDEITPLYAEFLNSKPLYPDNATALAAYREKLDELAARHGKSTEDYLNEARAAIPRSREHMDALQYMRTIGFLSQRG